MGSYFVSTRCCLNMYASGIGNPSKGMDKINANILWNLRLHSFLHTVNFVILLIVSVLIFTAGVRISNSETMSNAQDTARNVRDITRNMIPVSEVTAKAAMSNETSNITLAQAATDALTGVGHADWNSAFGNATLVMSTIANVNYSAVTGLFSQAQKPEYQKIIRTQIEHVLSSFDFASHGVSNILTIFKDGIKNEKETNNEKVDL